MKLDKDFNFDDFNMEELKIDDITMQDLIFDNSDSEEKLPQDLNSSNMFDSLAAKTSSYNFNLICEIIKNKNYSQNDISNIDNIVKNKIPQIFKNNYPENFSEKYGDFISEYEKFNDFVNYNSLIHKNIIALCGKASCGKTSFLKCFSGMKNVFSPDFAPIYIMNGKREEIFGINVFDSQINIKSEDVEKITKGFEHSTNNSKIYVNHIFKKIFCKTPELKYENAVFLESRDYTENSNDDLRRSLNSGNIIFWFISAEDSPINSKSLDFIKKLRKDIPKIFIISKADLKTLEELKKTKESLRESLDSNDIGYTGIYSFSDSLEEISDAFEREYIKRDTEKIKAYIDRKVSEIGKYAFAINFKSFFNEYKAYFENKSSEVSSLLIRFNSSFIKLGSMGNMAVQVQPMQEISKLIQIKLKEIKDIIEKTNNAEKEFFFEITKIAHRAGIDMPPLSEIDKLMKKSPEPFKVVDLYERNKGKTPDNQLIQVVNDILSDVDSKIDEASGGTKYTDDLRNTLHSSTNVNSDEIHINDVLDNTDDLIKIIESLNGDNNEN